MTENHQVDEELLYTQGLHHLKAGDYLQAEEVLLRLTSINPGHAEGWNKLGVIYARTKETEKAAHCFQAAIRANPRLEIAYNNLGNIYQERDQWDAAIAVYEKAIAINPDHHLAYYNLGVLYKKRGNLDQGIKLLKKASALERHNIKHNIKPIKRKAITTVLWLVAIAVLIYLLIWQGPNRA